MPNIDFGDIATWMATAVAIASAIAAAKSSKAAEKQHKEASHQARNNIDILEKEHELKLREWADQYFNYARIWAEEVCSAISEATHIVDNPELNYEHKRPILIRLSTLVDTGRWYFPNQWSDDYGTQKEPAYRGVRQPVLDCVVAAYDALKESGSGCDAKPALVMCQRQFVSYIQEVLDPRKRAQKIKKILSEFEISERLRMAPGKHGRP